MKLSFSTRGWAHLNWEEWLNSAVEMDFEGIDDDIPSLKIFNGEGANLTACANHVLAELTPWLREGKNG